MLDYLVDELLDFWDIEEEHCLNWLYVLIHHLYQIYLTKQLRSKSSVLVNDYFNLLNVVSITSDCKYFHSWDITKFIFERYADSLRSNVVNWILELLFDAGYCFILLGIALHIYYSWIWVCLKGNRNLWAREKLSSKSVVRTRSSGQTTR